MLGLIFILLLSGQHAARVEEKLRSSFRQHKVFWTSMGFVDVLDMKEKRFFFKGPGDDEIMLGFVMTQEQLLTKKHGVLMHFFFG